ncbi:MAG: hypothetical protein ACLGGX_03310 [Bdellovibrionia bacterium]
MKSIILLVCSVLALSACSSKNKTIKEKDIKTEFEKSESSGLSEAVVVNDDDDEIVVTKKTEMAEYIRQLSFVVKSKQDELYGSKKRGTRGLYGKLERCVEETAKKKNLKPEALPVLVPRESIVTDEEYGYLEEGKFGRDEKGSLVALDEKKLRDHIRDLESKKNKLYEKEEQLILELRKCEIEK